MSVFPKHFGLFLEFFAMSKEKPYLPTAEEIRLLQDLAPGWKDVWINICNELAGENEGGRLYTAARSVMRRLGLSPNDDRINDCVNTILLFFMKHVVEKRLFVDYDPEKGNIYAWLCNPKAIRDASSEFRKQFRTYKFKSELSGDFIVIKMESFGSLKKDGEETNFEDTIKSQSREIDDSVFQRLEGICSRLCEEPLTIAVPPEGKRINRVTEYGGLQLYPRLDRTVEAILRLIDHVHTAVRKADPLCGEPDRKIEWEHHEAEERICDKIAGYCDMLLKKILPETEIEFRRKLNMATLERFFFPLDTGQVMRLLDLSKDAVYQRRKEYKERLPGILPLNDDDIAFLKKLDILLENEEGGDNE